MSQLRNPFFSPPSYSPPFEQSEGMLYAAYEVVGEGNPTAEGSPTEPLVFECVVAGADGMLQPSGWGSLDWPRLAILEATNLKLRDWPANASPGDVVWYQFRYFQAAAGEEVGLLYPGLFSEGLPVHLKSANVGGPSLNQPPREVVLRERSPNLIEKSAKSDLKTRLNEIDTVGGVVAYDVGQGAAHGALGACYRPSVYIDFGGGVTGNTRTFPKEFKGFCFTAEPLIILTHWDWDHWSSALRQKEALEMTWLAPQLKKPLPIQHAFAMELAKKGKLYEWPETTTTAFRGKTLVIEKCTGKTSNDSGLAVTVRREGTRKRFLIPGDASYGHIPSVMTGTRLDGLSMTHHGGVLHDKAYPTPKRGAAAILSVGATNSHGHPRLGTIDFHLEKKWKLPLSTGFSGQRPSHVYVGWGEQPRIVAGGCGRGACSTALHKLVPKLAGVALVPAVKGGPYLSVSAPKPKPVSAATGT
ncbi:hypothetical protein SAMN05518669_1063 [Variovorax sp. YR634]|uniref:hypothetical protein n=1 Tax=Variovorax sp. YR634 TaxID=1884385 RepID=UPI0008964A4D|nr:hypothetical protein [Variovorax sp. YR634]SDX67225.1 hypothetical protein SAMN05518669_1063 [Variovorax sp. YR634]